MESTCSGSLNISGSGKSTRMNLTNDALDSSSLFNQTSFIH